MKKIVLISIIALIFSGCSTSYQKKGFTGGFSETQLGENIFQVSFRSNAYTSSEKNNDLCLLRCAELTLENNYRYFAIVDTEKSTKKGAYTTPTQYHTTANVYSYGNYATGSATTRTTGGQTFFFSKPRTNNTILCFKEKPSIDSLVFDAQFVSKSIKEKYGIKD